MRTVLKMHHLVRKEADRIKKGEYAEERTEAEEEDLDTIMKHYPTEFILLNKNLMKDILANYIN
jgi:hypothetical protein